MRVGVFARNLFVDWFGGSTRTNRELLVRLAGRGDVEVDFIPVVDEVYWRFRGVRGFGDMVLRWVETYRGFGINIDDSLVSHYVLGDLHRVWGSLFKRVLGDYDVVYDPILMPMANPNLHVQIANAILPRHYLLDYLAYNRNGRALALVIGSGDVPLSFTWFLRFSREFLLDNLRRVVGLGLFIARTQSLIRSLMRFRDRILYLLPSNGLLRKIPMLRFSRYSLFYPFYAIDDRVREVVVNGKDDYAVFLSRLDLTKGVLDLPKIIHYLNNVLKCGVEVKVVGGFEDGHTERAFWRRVDSLNVRRFIDFIGFVPDDRKTYAYEVLSSARVLIYPSHVDVVPNVVIESLFLRTPVVMYSIPGPMEVFSGTRAINFVPEFNVKLIAQEVCNIVRNDGDLFDERAMDIVRAHSDWEPIINKFSELLRSMVIYG